MCPQLTCIVAFIIILYCFYVFTLGRALPIPVSSRRNTDQSSTIYSELDDNTIKVLNRTYDSVVNASNPYTTGGTLDVIEEFANDVSTRA